MNNISVYISTPDGTAEAGSLVLPDERTFREAWRLNGTVVEIDMNAARAIWRDRIRRARQPELEALDAAFMKALETGDAAGQASIAARKQELRDAPADPAIDAAADVDALKAVCPAGLEIL